MLIKKILRDEKGAVLPLVALFIFFVALGVSALVIDVGMLYSERRSMVTAADAGALAGAQELNKTNDLSEILMLARDVSIKNGAEAGNLAGSIQIIDSNKAKLDDGKIIIEVDKGSVNKYSKPYVEVTTNKNTKHFFARIFGDSDTDVKAAAVASYNKISFQEFVFPLGSLYSDFYDSSNIAKVNVPVYFHDRKPLLGNSSWSGLLDLNPVNGQGAKEIQEIITDRLEFPVAEFLKTDNDVDYYIDVANGWKTFSESIGMLITKSLDLPVAQRKEYLTGYIPVLKNISILPNGSKNVPILVLAEFVVVDYANNQNDWLTKNYDYKIDEHGIEVYYENIITGKSLPDHSENDTIMGYFTGKTITMLNAYSNEVKVFLFK